MSTMRLTLNPDFEYVLEDLKNYYPLLESPELVKLAVSQFYTSTKANFVTTPQPLSDSKIKQIHSDLKAKGKVLGKKFLAKKGITDKVSEEEMYNLIKNA
jgi:hypothetical protein